MSLLPTIASSGYLGLALGIMAENAGIPVPGETMLLAAAVLAAQGTLRPIPVVIIATCAAIVGDNIGFAIGRAGGRRVLDRLAARSPRSAMAIVKTDAFYEKNGPWAVFLARFVAGARVVGALVAGSTTMPWRTFVIFNALGAVAWATLITTIGYQSEKAAARAANASQTIHLAIGVLIVAVVLGWIAVYLVQRAKARAAVRRERKDAR